MVRIMIGTIGKPHKSRYKHITIGTIGKPYKPRKSKASKVHMWPGNGPSRKSFGKAMPCGTIATKDTETAPAPEAVTCERCKVVMQKLGWLKKGGK